MANNGLHIVNGNINGDEEREFTFIGEVGYSAVNYVTTNVEGRQEVGDMKMGKRAEPNYLPLEVILLNEAEETKERERQK